MRSIGEWPGMRPSYEAFGLGVDGGAGGSELGFVT